MMAQCIRRAATRLFAATKRVAVRYNMSSSDTNTASTSSRYASHRHVYSLSSFLLHHISDVFRSVRSFECKFFVFFLTFLTYVLRFLACMLVVTLQINNLTNLPIIFRNNRPTEMLLVVRSTQLNRHLDVYPAVCGSICVSVQGRCMQGRPTVSRRHKVGARWSTWIFSGVLHLKKIN